MRRDTTCVLLCGALHGVQVVSEALLAKFQRNILEGGASRAISSSKEKQAFRLIRITCWHLYLLYIEVEASTSQENELVTVVGRHGTYILAGQSLIQPYSLHMCVFVIVHLMHVTSCHQLPVPVSWERMH